MSDKDLRSVIGANIQYYMDKTGKDRKQVCKDLDYPYTTFVSWLYGQNYPRIDRIEEMAKYFGCSVVDLVGERKNGHLESYYVDSSARDYAEFLYAHPEYKVLFDASRNVRPEDIDFVREMLDRMKGTD